MKVLLVHNFYQQPGGEDVCYAAEAQLLESRGHEVIRFTRHNDAIARMSPLRVAKDAIWSAEVYRELSRIVVERKPDVAHFHNTLPVISPSAHHAAKAKGAAVVQSLHNYRIICPSATLTRRGRVCEDCVGRKFAWPGILHACYRESRPASATVAGMLSVHRALGTWTETIDTYIALTAFSRDKFIASGMSPERIIVKPNFVHPDPGPGRESGGYALFVGRLSPEKGLDTLLDAWRRLGGGVKLKIVGDGPLAAKVGDVAGDMPDIETLGWLGRDDVMDLIGGADFAILPSRTYETFGVAAVEAFARGKPVIASRLGAMAEIVEDGRTGLHFRPGDPDDLAAKVRWAVAHREEMRAMGARARDVFLREFSAARNYEILMGIYEAAIGRAQRARE